MTQELHHEVELAVALERGGLAISVEEAEACIFGYAVAIDLTRRDLQQQAKDARRPWTLAKGGDGSAPIGLLHRTETAGHPRRGGIWLEVDGERRQAGDLAAQIWQVPEVIAALSAFVRLAPGDLILTGTPAGVGPLRVGNRVRAGIDGLGELALSITAPAATEGA